MLDPALRLLKATGEVDETMSGVNVFTILAGELNGDAECGIVAGCSDRNELNELYDNQHQARIHGALRQSRPQQLVLWDMIIVYHKSSLTIGIVTRKSTPIVRSTFPWNRKTQQKSIQSTSQG
ncbi:hypothetical protein HYFRA_00013163 [Hymenoscyphus fraxineus]|uniref:Uncharacterized protein n=1 Tax=Hymenoscyphus fraxineus TaxID=746836 RepID=A0A9N9L4I1_9HELO|nr:hypothetical protein HYFRA_00013163 [Hymenoscyphus fraxineus]